MIRIFGIFLAVITFFIAFSGLYYIEQENCSWKHIRLELMFYVMIAASMAGCLYSVQKNTYIYVSGCMMSGYIAYSAWTDHCNRYIYALPFVFMLILYVVIYVANGGSVSSVILTFITVTILYFICCKAGRMGAGDMYVIASECLMLPNMQAVAISLCVAAVIFLLSNIRAINWKKMRLVSGQAFIPALALGIIAALII